MPATTEDHSLQTTVHRAHRWEYADASAREAAAGLIATDVGKLALQLDNYSFWVLTAVTPEWSPVGIVPNVRTVSGADAAEVDDDIVFLDPTAAPFNFTLLLAADRTRPLTLVNVADPGSSANAATYERAGADVFGAAAATSIDLQPGERNTILPRTSTVWEVIG